MSSGRSLPLYAALRILALCAVWLGFFLAIKNVRQTEELLRLEGVVVGRFTTGSSDGYRIEFTPPRAPKARRFETESWSVLHLDVGERITVLYDPATDRAIVDSPMLRMLPSVIALAVGMALLIVARRFAPPRRKVRQEQEHVIRTG